MQSEFVYPDIADRSASGVWEEEGSLDICQRARERVHELLSSHYPDYIDSATDDKICARFFIRLAPQVMRSDPDRW